MDEKRLVTQEERKQIEVFTKACFDGDENTVRQMLKNSISPDTKTVDTQKPALIFAAENNKAQIVDILVQAGANIGCRDQNGFTPLGVAAMKGATDVIKQLVTKYEVNIDNADCGIGMLTALQMASAVQNVESVRTLLELGADPNAQYYRLPPLGVAAEGRRAIRFVEKYLPAGEDDPDKMLQCVKLLIEHGADFTLPCGDKTKSLTPLLIACSSERSNIFKYYLEHGAKLNDDKLPGRDDGNTVINYAAVVSNAEIIGMILDAGCNIDSTNNNGETPLSTAVRRGDVEIAKLLISRGADVNKADNNEATPLNIVAGFRFPSGNILPYRFTSSDNHYASVEMLDLLLDAKADVDKADKNGNAPLHYAVRLDEELAVPIAERLLACGADVNARNNAGRTPLATLSRVAKNNKNVFKLLFKSGADANIPDNDGKTPVYFMAGQLYLAGVKLLQKYGADVNFRMNNGDGLLHYTCRTCVTFGVRLGPGTKISKFLLALVKELGLDANAKNNDGKTMVDICNEVYKLTHFDTVEEIIGK